MFLMLSIVDRAVPLSGLYVASEPEPDRAVPLSAPEPEHEPDVVCRLAGCGVCGAQEAEGKPALQH